MLANEVTLYTDLLHHPSLAQHDTGTRGTGSNLPTLNPLAAPFTPHGQAAHIAGPTSPASDTPTVRPPSPHRSTPPSLERFARDLRALKSSSALSSRERLARLHDQRRQLLSHMGSAKAEMEELEGRLVREESVEGSQDVLNRLKDLRGLQEWAGHKWAGLGEEMADLEAEIAMPGGGGGGFWVGGVMIGRVGVGLEGGILNFELDDGRR